MYVLYLFVLIILGILLALAIDRRVEEVLPPYIFLFLIFLYCIAILKKPHHAFELSINVPLAIWGLFIVRKRRIVPKINDIKEKVSFKNAPGFWVYILVVCISMYCYSNHFVNNWDDFHFNATFARDMFLYKGMPTGWKAATGYKTYKPFMQMFYNWGFQGAGLYSEPLMFQYKSFLLLTGLLPLFDLVRKIKSVIGKVAAATATIILPYSFMFEVVDSLSMDGMMGILFGYCLIMLASYDRQDWFWYVRMSIALSSLALVKSTGVIFLGVVLGTWFLIEINRLYYAKSTKNKVDFKDTLLAVITCVPAGILWLSWKIFCDRNGNTTFLNNILNSQIEGKSGLPWYGRQTIINAVKQIFTLNMNLGKIGLSFAVVIGIIIVVFILKAVHKKDDINKRIMYVSVVLCSIPYIAVLIYTYIFVFFDYEAIELASYDRYLGTYALGILMFAIFDIYMLNDKLFEKIGIAISVILVITLNYPYLWNSLIPRNYLEFRQDIYNSHMEAKREVESIEGLVTDAYPIIIVGNESNTMYARSLDYYVLPMVSSYVDVYSYDADTDGDGYADVDGTDIANRFDGKNSYTGGVIEDLTERFSEGYDGYVYFNNHLTDSDDITIFEQFVEGGHIQKGKLYKCNDGLLFQE